MMLFRARCEYCGHSGMFGADIELRKPPGGKTERMVCKDRKACDARDEKREREFEEARRV